MQIRKQRTYINTMTSDPTEVLWDKKCVRINNVLNAHQAHPSKTIVTVQMRDIHIFRSRNRIVILTFLWQTYQNFMTASAW